MSGERKKARMDGVKEPEAAEEASVEEVDMPDAGMGEEEMGDEADESQGMNSGEDVGAGVESWADGLPGEPEHTPNGDRPADAPDMSGAQDEEAGATRRQRATEFQRPADDVKLVMDVSGPPVSALKAAADLAQAAGQSGPGGSDEVLDLLREGVQLLRDIKDALEGQGGTKIG